MQPQQPQQPHRSIAPSRHRNGQRNGPGLMCVCVYTSVRLCVGYRGCKGQKVRQPSIFFLSFFLAGGLAGRRLAGAVDGSSRLLVSSSRRAGGPVASQIV